MKRTSRIVIIISLAVLALGLTGVGLFCYGYYAQSTGLWDCVFIDSDKYGKPVMFPSNEGTSFGITSLENHFPAGQDITLDWVINNRLPIPQYYSTCTGNFSSYAVYDKFGNLIQTSQLTHNGKECAVNCSYLLSIKVQPYECKIVKKDVSQIKIAGINNKGTYDVVLWPRSDDNDCSPTPPRVPNGPAFRITVE